MEISVIIRQMLILFIMIGVGAILRKTRVLSDPVDSGITKMIITCTMPAMLLNSVISRTGDKDFSLVLKFIVIAFAMYTILPLIAIPLTRLLRVKPNVRGIYMYLLIFGNVGFMGFPLIEALFGTESILYAGIFNMFFNLLAYSYGVIIVSKDSVEGEVKDETAPKFKISAKTLLTPGISVSVLALIIFFLPVKFPSVICSAVGYIGNTTTPLAMIVLGSTLAKMKPGKVFTDKAVYLYVLVRGILLPLALFPLMKLLIKDTFVLQMALIMLSMPAANTSVLYAKEYHSDELFAARCVFLSTLFSVITIPLILIICLR